MVAQHLTVRPVPYGTAPKPLQPSPALQALYLALRTSKRVGHTTSVAHAVGIYPA